MKLKILSLLIMLGLLQINVFADKLQLPKCDNKSTCVNDKNFYVEVKRVVRRGEVVIVQLIYRGKTSKTYHFTFNGGVFGKKGDASILDAEGNEFKIFGKEISNFFLSSEEEKIISFKFKGNAKTKIVEPFDLTIKTYSDEITLFDLKS